MGGTQAEGWRNTKGKQERGGETRQDRRDNRKGRINNRNEHKQAEVRSYKKEGGKSWTGREKSDKKEVSEMKSEIRRGERNQADRKRN